MSSVIIIYILSFAFPCHSIPLPFHSILFIGAGGYTKVVLMYNNHMPHQHQYHHQQQQHNQCCTVLNWLYCYCDCDQLNTHIRIRSEAEAEAEAE
jgi:hypothetical protein